MIRLHPLLRTALLIALPLSLGALGACKKGGAKQTGGTAEGTILPGSASDAMLPLDQVRSQPPLAPRGSAESAGAGDSKPGSKATAPATPSDAASEAAVAPAPSAAPASAAPDPAAT